MGMQEKFELLQCYGVRRYHVKEEGGTCGEYMPTGDMTLSQPPGFVHMCSGCKTTATFDTAYPTVRYAPIQAANSNMDLSKLGPGAPR